MAEEKFFCACKSCGQRWTSTSQFDLCDACLEKVLEGKLVENADGTYSEPQ